MRPEIQQLLSFKREEYPFLATTPIKHPRPETANEDFHFFIRVPDPQLLIAYWGFQTEAQRDSFIKAYDAERYDWPS